MVSKRTQRDELIAFCGKFLVKATDDLNKNLVELGTTPLTASVRLTELLKRPQLNFEVLASLISGVRRRLDEIEKERRKEIIEAAEILIKYDGYIARERELAEKQMRLDYVKIPESFHFSELTALSTEARQKLERIRPTTIGQASRIPGVSPSDINVLLLLLHR